MGHAAAGARHILQSSAPGTWAGIFSILALKTGYIHMPYLRVGAQRLGEISPGLW